MWYILCGLAVFVGCVVWTKGEVSLKMSPEFPEKGNKVILSCDGKMTKNPEAVDKDCTIWWTRTSFPARSVSREPVLDTFNTKIVTDVDKKSTPFKYKSVLTIMHMDETMKGQYTCSFWCPGSLEVANIEIKTYGGIFGNEKDSLIGAFIVVMTILFVLIGSFCLSMMDCWSKGPRSYDHPAIMQISSSQSYASVATEESHIEHIEGSHDPPPRYSLVVVTSSNGTETALVNGRQELLDRLNSDNGSINSVFIVPSPPPNYTQAIIDLAEKGIFFRDDSVPPAMPSRKELPHVTEIEEV